MSHVARWLRFRNGPSGAGVFVRAFAKIADRYPAAKLLMIGQGVEVPTLKALAAELAPGRVEFRSPQSAEHLSKEFSSAAAALASVRPAIGYDFAFATKSLAGLSAGAPVIYAGVGPMGALIRDNDLGWAVDWDDDAVSEAMDKALSDHPDTARREHLSQWVRDNYSLDTVAGRTADLVDRLHSASAKPRGGGGISGPRPCDHAAALCRDAGPRMAVAPNAPLH